MVQPVLYSNLFEKKRSLEDLIEESKIGSDFFLYLSASTVITTFGLLTDNAPVVIGGMLVAPILYPILSLSMAVATSSANAIKRSVRAIAKATMVALCISLIVTVLFGEGTLTSEILLRAEGDLMIAFLIALFAGIAAAFGWVKQRSVSSVIAGIAVSVSLLPPLATVGIGFAFLAPAIIKGAITLFLVNLLGIVLAGIIIFALFGFSNLHTAEEQKIKEEIIEGKIQAEAKLEAREQEKANESLLTNNDMRQS